MTAYDGTIRINTDIDTAGVEKGINSIKGNLNDLAQTGQEGEVNGFSDNKLSTTW